MFWKQGQLETIGTNFILLYLLHYNSNIKTLIHKTFLIAKFGIFMTQPNFLFRLVVMVQSHM